MPDTETEQVEPEELDAPEAPEPEKTEEPEQDSKDDDLPDWVKEKIRKANNEARNLRNRLKEQEPLVTAAQEAEREKLTELERERADKDALKAELSQRDTQLLQARYQIPDDFIEFIGEGTFEEKEARAVKVGQMVQPKTGTVERPPSERPIGSLKPGASPSTPPVEDHSYPVAWTSQAVREPLERNTNG